MSSSRQANNSPEPTAVAVFGSAVAGHVTVRRWLSFLRLGFICPRWCIFVVLALCGTCLPGCVTNISHDTRYRTDYMIDGTYRVKKALFLDRGQRSIFGTWDYRILQLPNSRIAGIPGSVAQYEQERAHDWRNIAGVVPVGTRIRVTKVKLERNPETGRMIWIEGVILDGDLAGTRDVELSFISRKIRDKERFVELPMVNKEILESVIDP